jgi:lysophospholipase L1-like esterase
MIARTSIGGHTVRVRLSNALGAQAVKLGTAHIAIRVKDSAIQAKSDRTLTFSGAPSATMYAGQVLISDPVTLDVPPLTDLAVSLYFPGETGSPASHLFALRPTYVSKAGDFTGAPFIGDAAATMESYYWLAGIDVLAPAAAGALVTFGDSITDGDQSTPDTIGMWPALLAARLQANKATSHVAVVNAGISGNRVLGDNASALARLYHDALDQPGIKWMTVLEGINDITGATRQNPSAPPLKADNLIAAYRQIIDAAHMRGVKVIGCTLTPYLGSNVYNDSGEAIRSAVNQWIRTGGAFDGVIDFDAATRDPADPKRFSPKADSPDFLHPANPGYKMMADAINLSLFKR